MIRVDSSDLSDLERSRNFQVNLYNYARTVSPRITVFGVLIQMERSIHLGFSHVAMFRGRPQRSRICGTHIPMPKRFDRERRHFFGTTHVEKARVSGDHPPTNPKEAGPQRP